MRQIVEMIHHNSALNDFRDFMAERMWGHVFNTVSWFHTKFRDTLWFAGSGEHESRSKWGRGEWKDKWRIGAPMVAWGNMTIDICYIFLDYRVNESIMRPAHIDAWAAWPCLYAWQRDRKYTHVRLQAICVTPSTSLLDRFLNSCRSMNLKIRNFNLILLRATRQQTENRKYYVRRVDLCLLFGHRLQIVFS